MFNGTNDRDIVYRKISRLEQEARMVLPGIQAIFGFQLIVVFTDQFTSLNHFHQALHFVAVLMIAIAICLIMTPPAWHRHAEEKAMTMRFLHLSARLIKFAMFFLSVGICMEIYIIGDVIFSNAIPKIVTAILFLLFVFGWFIFPSLQKHRKA